MGKPESQKGYICTYIRFRECFNSRIGHSKRFFGGDEAGGWRKLHDSLRASSHEWPMAMPGQRGNRSRPRLPPPRTPVHDEWEPIGPRPRTPSRGASPRETECMPANDPAETRHVSFAASARTCSSPHHERECLSAVPPEPLRHLAQPIRRILHRPVLQSHVFLIVRLLDRLEYGRVMNLAHR